MSSEREFWLLLSKQCGLIRASQAVAVGVTRGQLRYWVKAGRLRQVDYGIYAASGAPRDSEQEIMFGVLLGSSRAVDRSIRAAVCGISAAMRLDLVFPRPNPIHILSQRKVRPRNGYVFHWTSRLPEGEIIDVRGIPTTDGPRSFLDLCSSHPNLARWAYRRGLRQDVLSKESVEARIEDESRQGREGLVLARSIIEATDPSAGDAKSAEEDRYFDFLVEAGYPPPARNARSTGASGISWEIDLFYEGLERGFEVSPWDTHGDPFSHGKDGTKIIDLARVGVAVYPINKRLSRFEFLEIAFDLLGPPKNF